MTNEENNRNESYGTYDTETKKYIWFMCKKGCKFYKNGCTKERAVRECAKKV